MKLPKAVAIAGLLGCVILSILLLRAHHELARANTAFASAKSAHAELNAHLGELESKVIDDALLKRLENDLESTSGVAFLSSTKLMIFSGRQERTFVGNIRPTPDGMFEFGSSIDLISTLAADGTSVDLAVDAKLTLPNTSFAPQR